MRHGERGTALAETALVVTLAATILFNGIQLALVGFDQIHADSSAFAAARLLALTGKSASSVQGTVTSLFPPAADSYGLTTPSTTIAQANVAKNRGGLILFPGVTAVSAQGQAQELIPPAAASSPGPFTFSVPQANTFLNNYYAPGQTGKAAAAMTTHTLYLAQSINTSTNSQGWNGAFAEWLAHEKCFAALNFPSQYPTGSNATSWINWNSTGNGKSGGGNSTEQTIYGWDSGSTSGKC